MVLVAHRVMTPEYGGRGDLPGGLRSLPASDTSDLLSRISGHCLVH
jgi:hypothetical protein